MRGACRKGDQRKWKQTNAWLLCKRMREDYSSVRYVAYGALGDNGQGAMICLSHVTHVHAPHLWVFKGWDPSHIQIIVKKVALK
jgi:hypothetical protein